MTARGILIGVLGAVAIMATFAFSATDRASAEGSVYVWSIECHPDSGVWYVTDGSARVSQSNINCDESKPGWTFDTRQNTLGDILFLYDGDRVPGTGLRAQEQGNKRPLVATNPPLADGQSYTAFTYKADANNNNRAVRGDDGQCYREQKVGTQWKRSAPYGPWNYQCRNASWNAYYRSLGKPLLPIDSGSFPSWDPPAATN